MPIVSLDQVDLHFDEKDPPGYRAGQARLGPGLGARDTGASLFDLPPGQALCPYHFEYAEEEWALVLEGTPTLRNPAGERTLQPRDLAFFPKGPAGAHQLRNDGEGPVRLLLWSSVVIPSATEYLDSGKVGLHTGDDAHDLMARRADSVGYYADEAPPGGDA